EGRVLHERGANLDEAFFHVEARLRNRQRRAALTVEVVQLEVAARLQLEGLGAILATERQRDRVLRPRGLATPTTEVAGDGAGHDALLGVAGLEALSKHVVEHVRRDRA